MKEEKNLNPLLKKRFWRFRYFNLAQLSLVLLLGNVLYFSYGLYFQPDISSHIPAVESLKNNNIQVIK